MQAGPYEARFRPDCAMLCTSLRHDGEQYVARPRSLAEYRAGGATAIPLLHPWANRLAQWGYDAGGREVDLHGLPLPTDPNGLPMHGNLFGVPFTLVDTEASRVRAEFDYGARPEKLAAFPFPHIVGVDARLDAEHGLTITTTVTPTGSDAVPVSFGWHPYLRLPHGGRNTWKLRWPACTHVELSEKKLPTGTRTGQPAEREPIGRRTFDDHYALGDDRTFAIIGDDRELTLTFGAMYPFAQLFVPPRRQLLAIEPMTATVDALGAGTAAWCEPGDRFDATFSIAVTR